MRGGGSGDSTAQEEKPVLGAHPYLEKNQHGHPGDRALFFHTLSSSPEACASWSRISFMPLVNGVRRNALRCINRAIKLGCQASGDGQGIKKVGGEIK